MRVNYVSRRICALIGSSVNLSSKYSHPDYLQPKSKLWYKIKRIGQDEDEVLDEAVSHDNMRDQHTVTINKLKKTDEAEYKFRLQHDDQTQSDFPGVTLFVTGIVNIDVHTINSSSQDTERTFSQTSKVKCLRLSVCVSFCGSYLKTFV